VRTDRLAENPLLEMRRQYDEWRRTVDRDRVGALAVWFVFRLGLRVSIPTPRVDPTPPLPLREVDARWTTVGDRLDALLRERGREAPDRPLVRHPVAGPMDQRRLVAFLRAHIRHHRRQLERIREGD
jgi:hypothetical protein